jgi:hydrogenase expression/formation protein HypD
MKYVDEYRDERIARALVSDITHRAKRPWVLMEVCGGQTHTLMRYGIDDLMPAGIQLVHGPGCPVCVTSLETIDKAVEIASRPDTTLVSYGDMLRVPGSRSDLFHVKAAGGDVRIVYSPLEALKIAASDSRPPPRPMRWPSGRPGRKVSKISPCSLPTFSCRRRCACYLVPRRTECRDSSPQDTSAP